jgi:hypothetical protein
MSQCAGFLFLPVTEQLISVRQNSDPQGRALNRRVEVKVIVNKGLDEGRS